MNSTSRLQLPFLVSGQAQKETTVNEAMQRIDILTQPVVEGEPRSDPPSLPQVGSCYLVGPNPTGDWSQVPGAIAGWTEGGWRFVLPFDGLMAAIRGTGQLARFRAGDWQIGVVEAAEYQVAGERVVSARAPAIASPDGGGVVDAECRLALDAVLTSLRHHGLIAS